MSKVNRICPRSTAPQPGREEKPKREEKHKRDRNRHRYARMHRSWKFRDAATSSRLLVLSSTQVWLQCVLQMNRRRLSSRMPLHPIDHVVDPGDNLVLAFL